jgi:hypothetical protein
VVKRWFPRIVGALAALVLVPIVAQAGVRLYVAWFLRQGDRQLLERQVTVPGRGTLALRGAEIRTNVPDQPRTFAWAGTYQRAGSSSREWVGSWEARDDSTTAYAFGDLVVVVPNTDYLERGVQRVFVRKKSGKWREIRFDFGELADGIDPPVLTAYKTAIEPVDLVRIRQALGPAPGARWPRATIDRVDAARAEVLVGLTLGSTGLRLRLGLTEDGERVLVLGIDRATS